MATLIEQTLPTGVPMLPMGTPADLDLMAKVGAIAHQLIGDLPEEDEQDRQQALLERALIYAAEAEQRMADQLDRIALLENLSFNDPLTGLLNRRGFMNHLSKVLARSRRYGENGVVIYCDLDNFKSVNDTYGHAAGDNILIRAAATITASVREIDLVGRLGGDEFAIVLVDATWKDGAKRARTIQWCLDNAGLTYHGQKIPIKASLGAEPYGPQDTEEDLIRRADMAMYYEKRAKQPGLLSTAAE